MWMITIMPDFGFGPYAWVKDDSDKSTAVGGCIANAGCGFWHSEFKVSATLEADFAAWAMWFESDARDEPWTMDWDAFHQRGIALARRLKAELGDKVRVVYDTPVEDPSYYTYRGYEVRTEILAGGKLKLVAFGGDR